MILATYHAGSREDTTYDYKEYDEWTKAIKEDFRKFIEYKLINLDNSKELIDKLKITLKGLKNTCPYNIKKQEYYIIKGDKYFTIEYPVYCETYDVWTTNYVFFNSQYDRFIFVDSINASPYVSVFDVKDKVIKETLMPGIDLKWDEELLDHNLEYLKGNEDSVTELGGFLEYPEEFDGDFEAFNYCLASEYLSAMINEDFESIGIIDSYLLKDISHWLNYNGVIGKNDEELIKNIPTGEFITNFNRTFANAVADRNLYELAISLVENGSINPRLYLTIALNGSIENDINIFNYVMTYINTSREYTKFINNLFSNIDILYMQVSDLEKENLIEKITPFIQNIECFKDIINKEKYLSYEWMKRIKELSIVRERKAN